MTPPARSRPFRPRRRRLVLHQLGHVVADGRGTGRALVSDKALKYNYTNEMGVGGKCGF